jgi:integrase
LTIKTGNKAVVTFTPEEIKTLLAGASDQQKLYILLALNCGMTQKDISDLHPKEYDAKAGQITRRRSKERNKLDEVQDESLNVPIVTYNLWKTTIKLLNKLKTKDKDHLLLNERGGVLVRSWHEKGVSKKVDNIHVAYEHLNDRLNIPRSERKYFKQLKKTSATLLYNNKDFRQLHGLFLGHAPRTIAEKNYIDPILTKEAIAWLGEQYGIE